jgi:hypothetical protein
VVEVNDLKKKESMMSLFENRARSHIGLQNFSVTGKNAPSNAMTELGDKISLAFRPGVTRTSPKQNKTDLCSLSSSTFLLS